MSDVYKQALEAIRDWRDDYEEIVFPEVEAFVNAVLADPSAELVAEVKAFNAAHDAKSRWLNSELPPNLREIYGQ